MQQSLVSIVIPVYNRERNLSATLESVSSQSYRNLEIIVVNDGSTDASLEIIRRYAASDNRIKCIDKKNGGLPSARKSGVEASSGEYIIHFDADDIMSDSAIEKFVLRAKETSADIVTAKFITRYSDRDEDFKGEYFDVMSGSDYLRHMLKGTAFFCVWIRLCKRSLYSENNIVFNESISFGEDALLMTQLFYYAEKVAFLDYDVVIYNRTDDSMTRKHNLSHKKLVELHCFPQYVDRFLTSKGVREDYDMECGYMYVRNMIDLFCFKMFDFAADDIERCKNIIKKYPRIKDYLPKTYIKLFRFFLISDFLGKLYFRKKFGVFP